MHKPPFEGFVPTDDWMTKEHVIVLGKLPPKWWKKGMRVCNGSTKMGRGTTIGRGHHGQGGSRVLYKRLGAEMA